MAIENIEYRHVGFGALETRFDGDEGSFAGYANLHETTDSYGTRFSKGSWTSDSEPGQRAYLWMHNIEKPIGVFEWLEDDKGLWIEGRFDNTTDGRDAKERAASGSAPELSVGFIRRAVDSEDENRITGATLKEVSQITRGFASQPGAELMAMRKAAEIIEEMTDDAVLSNEERDEARELEPCPHCGKRVDEDVAETPAEAEAEAATDQGDEENLNPEEADLAANPEPEDDADAVVDDDVAPEDDVDDEDGEEEPPSEEEAGAVELTDDDLTGEPLPEDDEAERAGGEVTNPKGTEALHAYWTKGKGLALWADKPHPWRELYRHLKKYIKNPEKAKATAASWFHDVKGYWPGDSKNRDDDVTPEERERKLALIKLQLTPIRTRIK